MLTSIAAFIFVLAVLIFVHELGHFVMAKSLGVRVLTFSLGFGPKLLGFRRGDTDYRVSLLPLGGYVKMAGEHADEPRSGRADEFLSKSKWQRFQILIMGPAMNVLLAVVVLTLVLLWGTEVPAYRDQPPVVGSVAAGSAAARGGVKVGDRIVSVAGRTVDTWDQVFAAVLPSARRQIVVGLLRDGRELTVELIPDPQSSYEMGDIGVLPEMYPQIRTVTAGDPADRAGLKPGDVVMAVDGQAVTRERPLVETISRHAGVRIVLAVKRGRARLEIPVTPVKRGDVGRIGVELSPFELRRIEPGPIEAVQLSLQRNIEASGLILRSLGQLLTGQASPRQLVGPIGIAQLSGSAAQQGLAALLEWMAIISLNLGLLNLLPIPVLDGGHIFIMALEGVARRDFSTRVKEKVFLAGLAFLVTLMATVIYYDLTRIAWVEKLIPWR